MDTDMDSIDSPADGWLSAEAYHNASQASQPLTPTYVPATALPHVCYSPAHPNPTKTGSLAGQGNNRCIWIANEQGALAEGTSQGSLDGLIDSYLEPDASIGWHSHHHSEEYYYLLSGTLNVMMQDQNGHTSTFILTPGDRHWIGPGMSHCAQAGNEGARFIAIMLKCQGVRL